MRVLLDTNVLVAAVISRGLCAELLATVIQTHVWLTTSAIEGELDRVLREKFPGHGKAIRSFLEIVDAEAVELPQPGDPLDPPPIDPDDVPHLVAAVEGRADLFVTGDRELHELGRFCAVPIVSPRQAWPLLRPG